MVAVVRKPLAPPAMVRPSLSITSLEETKVTARLALTVLCISDSFESLWKDLADELGLELQRRSPADEATAPSNAVAVIIAAGGEEDRGLDALSNQSTEPSTPEYLIGGNPSHRFGVEAIRRGAADYFVLPEDLDVLRRSLSARVEVARERAMSAQPADQSVFASVLGESQALHAILDKAARVLPHGDVTVLISGETGTGKEILAKAIHDGSPRGGGPFVAINCAAIPANLLETELFGHEKGAFTDAHKSRPGLFEEASGGTLFLDEVGHVPIHLQGKLLRALEDKSIRRVGANQDRHIDLRIMAATLVDLEVAVQRGEFREDLYYRLNVVSLQLPPLRERGADLELLARSFTQSLAKRYNIPVPQLTSDFLQALRAHTWPGNVRELRHAIERALLLSEPGTLDATELALTRKAPAGSQGSIPFPAKLSEITSAAVHRTIELFEGNKSAAARHLGISRSRLQRIAEREGDAENDE